MRDPATDAAFRALAAQRRYSPATVDRWLHLEPADGAALLGLAQELRLGEHQLRDLWEWAEEIATRDRVPLGQVLAGEAVRAARQRRVSRNDKLALVKGALRRRRFPQLAAVEERLAALVRDLDLPRTVRVILPEFLEGDGVRVEIVADDGLALRAAANALLRAADSSACKEIFALLAEAP
jgi:ribonuclease D